MKKSLLLVVTPLAYNEYWVTRTKPPPQSMEYGSNQCEIST